MTDENKPWRLRRWSRRATAWAAGAAALIAGGSAAAVVATSGSSAQPRPTASSSNAALDTQKALTQILAADPTVGQPVVRLIKQGKLPKAAYAGDDGSVGVPAGVSHPTTPVAGAGGFVAGPTSGDFTLLQMTSLALSAGCSTAEAPVAGAIAAAESGGDSGAQGDITLMDGTWDWSEGLWQIRGIRAERGTGSLRDSLGNADPTKNAQAMMAISNGCTNWTPWSTYNTGAYLAYLPLSQSAAAAAARYHQQTGSYPPIGSGTIAGVPSPESVTSTRPTEHRSGSRPTKSVKPQASTTAPASKPTSAKATSSHPAPTKSTSASGSPTKPVKKPTPPVKTPSLPVKLPSLPVKLPTTLPVPLPTITLPSLPGLPPLP
jgi:hypothetical protein